MMDINESNVVYLPSTSVDAAVIEVRTTLRNAIRTKSFQDILMDAGSVLDTRARALDELLGPHHKAMEYVRDVAKIATFLTMCSES